MLFYEDKAEFGKILRQEPEKRDEVGIMQAMLSKGKVSSAA